jgi:hypothetical protein
MKTTDTKTLDAVNAIIDRVGHVLVCLAEIAIIITIANTLAGLLLRVL